MTRPLRPGRLAVRRNEEGYWSILSPIPLDRRLAGGQIAPGLYSYPFGGHLHGVSGVALRYSREYHARLQDHAALTEQCS